MDPQPLPVRNFVNNFQNFGNGVVLGMGPHPIPTHSPASRRGRTALDGAARDARVPHGRAGQAAVPCTVLASPRGPAAPRRECMTMLAPFVSAPPRRPAPPRPADWRTSKLSAMRKGWQPQTGGGWGGTKRSRGRTGVASQGAGRTAKLSSSV